MQGMHTYECSWPWARARTHVHTPWHDLIADVRSTSGTQYRCRAWPGLQTRSCRTLLCVHGPPLWHTPPTGALTSPACNHMHDAARELMAWQSQCHDSQYHVPLSHGRGSHTDCCACACMPPPTCRLLLQWLLLLRSIASMVMPSPTPHMPPFVIERHQQGGDGFFS